MLRIERDEAYAANRKKVALTRHDLVLLVAAGRAAHKLLPKSQDRDDLKKAIRRARSFIKKF